MNRKILVIIFFLTSVIIFATPAMMVAREKLSVKDLPFQIISPLPSFLISAFPTVLGSSYWRPFDRTTSASVEKPIMTADAIVSYDLTTDQFLYQYNSKKKLPIASLTKIMTAVVALENEPIDKEFTVSQTASEIGENAMGLAEGEKYTLRELLYGLILRSGNDAAEVIAEGSQFGRANFVYLMNKKAEDLGLTNTYFTNPSGLEGDGNQYSTAEDLLVVTRYAMSHPEFAKVSETYDYYLPADSDHKELQLYNQTNLLTTYPGVKGVKTGFTDEAGMCLVTYLDYEGHKIIAVLLNSENRREEMKSLLDYSLESLGVKPPTHQ